MKPFKNYIATWFYRESHEEASYYPQAGGRGDSALLHSVYTSNPQLRAYMIQKRK